MNLQYDAAVKKASADVVYINRSIRYNTQVVIVTLYLELVRPQLNYYVSLGLCIFKKDLDNLLRVQRQAKNPKPKMIKACKKSHMRRC